jgi:DNA/RNA endonuclease YhcR with UshA esterase domain
MVFGVPPVISAHHSVSAEYDTNQEVALKGVVSKIEYTNPHTALFIDVTDNDGTVTTWELELLPPAMLFRNGWTPTSVPVGVTLTVKCYLAKDGVHRAHANEAVMANGRKLRLGMNDPK